MKSRLILLLLIGCVVPLHAAEPLTWESALKRAADNNPDLLAAQRTVLSRQAQYSESFNGIMPRLNLTSSYNDSMAHNKSTRWQAGGSASIDLFNQSRFASIKSSNAGLDQAVANLRLTASTVLFDLRSAFASLLFAQEQLVVSDRIYEIRRKNSELVSLRYTSGRESKGNKMRAQAEILQAEVDVAQARRDLKAAQQEFNQRIGNDQFSAVMATGTLTTSPAHEPSSFEPIVNGHPSILLETANLESSEADLKQAWSSAWPALSANYNRSFSGEDYFPENPNWAASAVLSLPIFGSGPTSTYYNVASARRDYERAEQDMRSTRNDVRSNLESGWSNFAGANDQVRVQAAFLGAARQRNGEADVRYASGLMSYENWEQIVTDRVNFERSLVRAQRDAVIAEAQWNRSSGKGLGE